MKKPCHEIQFGKAKKNYYKKNSRTKNHPVNFIIIFKVHKIKQDQTGFNSGNQKSQKNIKNPKIDLCDNNSENCQNEKTHQDIKINLERDNMIF